MVPSLLIRLDALPVGANGKLDPRALPPPQADVAQEGRPPRTPLESTLADIWCKVLRLPRIGIDDEFFALGGNSIMTIQVCAAARAVGIALTAQAMFGTRPSPGSPRPCRAAPPHSWCRLRMTTLKPAPRPTFRTTCSMPCGARPRRGGVRPVAAAGRLVVPRALCAGLGSILRAIVVAPSRPSRHGSIAARLGGNRRAAWRVAHRLRLGGCPGRCRPSMPRATRLGGG